MNITGVITGDIVASRKLPGKSRERLYSDLRKFLATLKTKGLLTAYEMFRGDSIQCIVKNKEQSLRAALMIRAWLKSYAVRTSAAKKKQVRNKKTGVVMPLIGKQDIRLSIGIGGVDFVKKNSLAHSDGEAFHLSGIGLDSLKTTTGKIILETADTTFNEAIEPSMLLLDAVLQKWTSNQAEIILFKLKNYKEEQIAREIGISQSAVNQRTKTSQWSAIEKLLSWFEKTIKAW
ncbi:MAG: hypothetical protein ABIN89_02860 [Chitinophagaceae bacterium]